MFPSPCGAWVLSTHGANITYNPSFPSPYGAWVLSCDNDASLNTLSCRFRPLTGHGFYLTELFDDRDAAMVSVPLRGMGFITARSSRRLLPTSFRPLTGHGFYLITNKHYELGDVSVPLRGMGFILDPDDYRNRAVMFPSPYGAWVLSSSGPSFE